MSEQPRNTVEIKYLLERIERLERQASIQRGYSFPQQVRLAKTVQDPNVSDPKYPTSGNTFPFVFIEGDFPGAAGEQTATYNVLDSGSPPDPHGHCHNITGEYIPENTVVRLTKHVGINQDVGDGEWWIEKNSLNNSTVIVKLSRSLITDSGSERDYVLNNETSNVFRPFSDISINFPNAHLNLLKKSDVDSSNYMLTITKSGYYEFEFYSALHIISQYSPPGTGAYAEVEQNTSYWRPSNAITESDGSPSHTHEYKLYPTGMPASRVTVYLDIPDETVIPDDYLQVARNVFLSQPTSITYSTGDTYLTGKYAYYIDLEENEVEEYRINLLASHIAAVSGDHLRECRFHDYFNEDADTARDIYLKITRYATRPDI